MLSWSLILATTTAAWFISCIAIASSTNPTTNPWVSGGATSVLNNNHHHQNNNPAENHHADRPSLLSSREENVTTTTTSRSNHTAATLNHPDAENYCDQNRIRVRKRDGTLQDLNRTKLQEFLQSHCPNTTATTSDLDTDPYRDNNNNNRDLLFVNLERLTNSIVQGLYDGVSTDEIQVLAAETAAAAISQHPAYGILAANLVLSHNRRQTPSRFSEFVALVSEYLDDDLVDLVLRRYSEWIDSQIRPLQTMTYFGFKTLERAYLIKSDTGKVLERPEYLMMRVALGIHVCGKKKPSNQHEEEERIRLAMETYHHMASGYFTHASPTLFHAGTKHPQLSSCFLVQMSEDSIHGIYDTLKRCAVISKAAGGIGLSVHNIRARGTFIAGTRGISNGLVPMLRVYDVTSRYVDQGGGKRPGAFAIYLEPWHADIFDVLNLKKNHGKEEHRARDLFYGLWIPDLFMRRVEQNGMWSLMCPHQSKGLFECYGPEFDELYTKYEKEGRFVRQIRARDLWAAILESQIETGTPYMLYKDACNAKSNQQNLGTIQCSNLCTEIIQYTSPDEVAVCNLASICLSRFVVSDRGPLGSINPKSGRAYFDHEELHRVAKIVTRNLNKIIDINRYPTPESETSNMLHRPIGIGVSGLADVFLRLGLPFTSPEAKQLNAAVFETIYHAALQASMELAIENGPYETFEGSPASQGKLQFDLWGLKGDGSDFPSHVYAENGFENGCDKAKQKYPDQFASGYDWDDLRLKIMKFGLRNSLLVAPMPTASTSQILGVNECFEPFSSNLYLRRVKAGEFIMANPHLLQDLTDRGLWTPSIRNQMMRDGGSIQKIAEIPTRLKELYRTVWELKMKDIIDMAADRARFIDQSQSLNLFIAGPPDVDKLTSMHFYAWKKGLKTGMYYLRTKPAVNAIQYTVDASDPVAAGIPQAEADSVCLSCQA